ncbi:OmpA family protein [Saprospira grandis]|uniref:OmpA/MotB domain protein n=1 Tax=Saprospira grandis (strain Lewin) TaxID=984262 RepID=H6LAZ7_SAPGL|nr:OmpA family protein [Saprospira grandis]AFC26962.1 OmpA/MotB domain protein [Saprospira grandis str. Lewin]
MRRISFWLFLLLLLCSTKSWGQKTAFAVELAAFEQQVELNYFGPIKGVYELYDVNDFYRYQIPAKTKAEAEVLLAEVRAGKFPYARIIDFKAREEACKNSCGFWAPKYTGRNNDNDQQEEAWANTPKANPPNQLLAPKPKKTALAAPKEKRSLGSLAAPERGLSSAIFFDFNSSDIPAEEGYKINYISDLMIKNPEYTLVLDGHSDAIGEEDKNLNLSKERLEKVMLSLFMKGVEGERMRIRPQGELAPIAINEYPNGSDSPEGRRYNRRVQLQLLDENGEELPVLAPIEIPAQLKIEE